MHELSVCNALLDQVEVIAREHHAVRVDKIFPGFPAYVHLEAGDLIIGDSDRPEDVRRIAGWFESASVPCPISDDIRRDLWTKLIINSMANATSALARASYRALAEWALAERPKVRRSSTRPYPRDEEAIEAFQAARPVPRRWRRSSRT